MAEKSQDELLRSIMGEVTENLTDNLREVLSRTLEQQLTSTLTSSLLESEFYKKISKDMRGGLKKIYKELTSSQVLNLDKDDAQKLFAEASEQLEAVLEQTQSATDDIMNLVEKHMDLQAQNAELLAKAKKTPLTEEEIVLLENNNFCLSDDLTTILTSLSFQDLTGQRIKKATAAIKRLESMILELIISSSVMIKSYESKPNADIAELEAEANQAALDIRRQVENSELKGPNKDTNQADIDDLLSQFGL